ncbi:hypothetical protein E2F46_14955 [Luteimonas aestuarii]|uniref:STAS/SEC14 domain-containing protein n=1 Tax=Luteimonas aestuarii TaxID=453837 RepID=A0A4R5TJ79_9GAMM|nr:hypothetical protein [Luteimonas aestuarii]TDK21530.1 hypothetical protein E2F46_14955 [Luteimonas aestuarii]
MATPMPTYAIEFSVEGGCLRAVSTGVIDTLEGAIGLFRDIAVELRRVGARTVLIVDETSGIVPDADGFDALAREMAGEGYEGIRVAYVDVAGTALARVEVGEIVARIHGYRLRVFDNEAQAHIWLHYGRD